MTCIFTSQNFISQISFRVSGKSHLWWEERNLSYAVMCSVDFNLFISNSIWSECVKWSASRGMFCMQRYYSFLPRHYYKSPWDWVIRNLTNKIPYSCKNLILTQTRPLFKFLKTLHTFQQPRRVVNTRLDKLFKRVYIGFESVK